MAGIVRFGLFELDPEKGELRKQGLRLRLQDQPLRVLAALVEKQGEIVPRDELVHRLWADGTIVDFDRGLNAAVTRLRQVLADSAEKPRYIETVARRGYRFLAPVEVVNGPPFGETNGLAGDSGTPPISSRASRYWRIAGLAGGAAILLLSIATSLLFFPIKRETSLEQITRDPGLASDPALSPDGKLLAYASDRGSRTLNLWLKQLGSGGKTVQLTHDTVDAHQPSFSPDGNRIAYRSEKEGGGIFVIPTIGGEPMLIAPGGRNPRFSPDGKWIAYWVGHVMGPAPEADAAGIVFVASASGGEPKRVGLNLPGAGLPIWSADSKQLLVYASPSCGAFGEAADWWTIDIEIDGDVARKTGAFAGLRSQGFAVQSWSGLPRASDWTNGMLTFSAEKGDSRNIWQIRLKDTNRPVAGNAARLTEGTTLHDYSARLQSSLVFASLVRGSAIWSLPVNANDGKVTGELQQVTDGSTWEATPALASEGRLMVYGTTIPNHEDIMLRNLQTGQETTIASTASAEWHPVISNDGSMIAYTVNDGRSQSVYIVPTTAGKPKPVVAQGSGWIFDWTQDKQYLLFHPKNGDAGMKRVSVQSGIVSDYLTKSGGGLYQTKFSPDGEWLAFGGSFKPGRATISEDSRLFIVKLKNGLPAPESEWILVSDEHGWSDKPRWSPNGNILYFVSDRDRFLCIWAVRLNPATKQPMSEPFPVYHFHNSRLSLANIGLGLLEIDVANDKIVVALGELTGNIWSRRNIPR